MKWVRGMAAAARRRLRLDREVRREMRDRRRAHRDELRRARFGGGWPPETL